MSIIPHKENIIPKSFGHILYNTKFKNKIKYNEIYFNKNLPLTPLKSNINIMNSTKDENVLKYPLLKSISSFNINSKNKKNIYDYDEEDEYNKNALPDEIEDFMHIHENEIIIKNAFDNINIFSKYKKLNINLPKNNNNSFSRNKNYIEKIDLNNNIKANNISKKQYNEFNEYFNI